MFFFFKQKTAYEMRISDWSSDVCSSDLKQAIRIMEFPTSPEALLALKSGAADAMMEDAAVSHQMATEMKDDIKVTSNGLIYPIVIGLGVNKNKPELRDALSKALADARDSGEYRSEEHTSELQSLMRT